MGPESISGVARRPWWRRWWHWSPAAGKVLLALVLLVAVGLLLGVLAGVFQEKVSMAPVIPARVAPKGPVAPVRLIRRERYETATGTVKPVHEAAVASKLLARVLEVNVKAGQAVQQNDVLVVLDSSDLQSRLQQAQAAASAALALKQQSDANFERARNLRPIQAISDAEYERAELAAKSAAAEVQRTQQAVREAEVVLAYATVRAPFSGTIVDKRVESGDTVTPGQVLLTLYDPERMQLVASVRESLAQKLAVGQKIATSLESLGYECEATVSEVVPEAQAASRSFIVKVTGPCPPGVYSGMFGRLRIDVGKEDLVVVPAAAVRHVGQLTLVDVVDNGVIERRSVQLGRAVGDDIEVLAGLKPGEKVVLQP